MSVPAFWARCGLVLLLAAGGWGIQHDDQQVDLLRGQRGLTPADQRLLEQMLAHMMQPEEEGDQRSYSSITSKIPFRKWVYQPGHFLPTCAPQQVCNTVYPRLQRTNPQCVCPRGEGQCSPITLDNDGHSVPLVTNSALGALTTVKTCESNQDIRQCKPDDDWSLLAVQNIRSGKSNFLVICRCPTDGQLEGPVQHAQPHYAHVPTIRIYGMLCRRRPHRKHQKHHHRYRRAAEPGNPSAFDQLRRFLGGWEPHLADA